MPQPHEDHEGHENHIGHENHENHEDHGGHEGHEGHDPKAFRNRLAFSLVLTVPILYFSESFQAWFGYQALAFPGVAFLVPILATAVFLYGGMPFLRGAVHELSDRAPAMMTLIALAITVAYGFSMAVAFGFPGTPFFWELATLIDVMLLGHWIEMSSIQNAGRALDELSELLPTNAHRYSDDDTTTDVPLDHLQVGDRILVRPGEQIPADGTVLDGDSSVNEAFLTGESRPIAKSEGDEIAAGAVNGEGALDVEITRIGDDTALSQIVRLVDEAQAARSRFQGLADRAAGWLAYVAAGAGLITFVTWMGVRGDVTFAVTLAVTVLVIACPHALGLAIPLVTVNATSVSARHGILVRNREAFERARELHFVAFDKTGTLTHGEFAVTHVETDEGTSESEAYRAARALEARSEHPLGQAIVRSSEDQSSVAVEDFEVRSGRGVAGTVDGTRYRIGRPEWANEEDVDVSGALRSAIDEADGRGESVVVLMNETHAIATFALADRVRDSAKRTVARLKDRGVEPVMITGDAEAVARTVAEELGIDRWYARVLPQDKSSHIEELQKSGRTAFVGDGINDAPALLTADLGIAIGAGTNVAIESADLVLVEDDPEDVLRALELSRLTYNKMVQNLIWATGYNVIALPLAAGIAVPLGFTLSPAVGALAMSASTVIVAINAMTLRRARLT